MTSSHPEAASHPGRPTAAGEPPPAWAMRTYVLALLFRGPHPESDPAKAQELFLGHMANSARMYEASKLLLAGPMRDDGDLRGIWIFDSDSIDECRALVEGDPAVQQGLFRVEYHPWYSARGITIARPDVTDTPPTAR